MKINFTLISFLILFHGFLSSQDNAFQVLDLRKDTMFFGLINKKTNIIIPNQVNKTLFAKVSELREKYAWKDELLLVVRKYYYAVWGKERFLYLEAELYKKAIEDYSLLRAIDTIVKDEAGADKDEIPYRISPLEKLFERSVNQDYSIAEDRFRWIEIAKRDSLEKAQTTLYQKDTYKDGVYKTIKSFNNQEPEEENFEFGMDENLKFRLYMNKDGKNRRVSPSRVFAVVRGGKPYIGNNYYGFYFLHREGNEFRFRGQLNNPFLEDVNYNRPGLEAIEALASLTLTSKSNFGIYWATFDYRSGKIIPFRIISQ